MSFQANSWTSKVASVAFGVILGLALVAIILLITTRPDTARGAENESTDTTGDQPESGPSTGRELADELGLVLLPRKPRDCNSYTEVGDPAGFCLDEVTDTNEEFWEIANRLAGHVPTDQERAIFQLSQGISEASEAGDQELMDELSKRLSQLYQD